MESSFRRMESMTHPQCRNPVHTSQSGTGTHHHNLREERWIFRMSFSTCIKFRWFLGEIIGGKNKNQMMLLQDSEKNPWWLRTPLVLILEEMDFRLNAAYPVNTQNRRPLVAGWRRDSGCCWWGFEHGLPAFPWWQTSSSSRTMLKQSSRHFHLKIF